MKQNLLIPLSLLLVIVAVLWWLYEKKKEVHLPPPTPPTPPTPTGVPVVTNVCWSLSSHVQYNPDDYLYGCGNSRILMVLLGHLRVIVVHICRG